MVYIGPRKLSMLFKQHARFRSRASTSTKASHQVTSFARLPQQISHLDLVLLLSSPHRLYPRTSGRLISVKHLCSRQSQSISHRAPPCEVLRRNHAARYVARHLQQAVPLQTLFSKVSGIFRHRRVKRFFTTENATVHSEDFRVSVILVSDFKHDEVLTFAQVGSALTSSNIFIRIWRLLFQ